MHSKSFRFAAILGLFFGFLLTLAAFDVPGLTGRVVDQAGTLSSSEQERLDQTVQLFETKTGGQVFVAFLKPFDDATIEEAGIKLMDAWKPGEKGKDNGAILLIVPEMRKMRLEIGYGWEGNVPDAKAGDIIRKMAPFFREERYCDGARAAVGELAYDITGERLDDDLPMPDEETAQNGALEWIPFLIILAFFIISCFFGRGKHGGGGFHFGGFSGGGGGGFHFGGGSGGFSGGGGGGRGGGGGASGSW